MTETRATRRQFIKSAAAGAAVAAFPKPSLSQGAGPPVVVIGGGFGGAGCARALRQADPRLAVTLVEARATYTALPHSNAVIGGLVELTHQQFGYDKIKSAGVKVALSAATAIDPAKKTVTLANGTTLNYERLVVSPGIDFRDRAIQGYEQAAMEMMPPAYSDGAQIALIRKQLEAMEDGGTVVISSPVNPARCPPAPYERASLIAHYLKSRKPKSKVVVLDAKESFTMQKLFEAAWAELYPGMIEWVGLSQGGALSSVDAATKTFSTDFDKYKAAVGNVIPPQKAGRVAELAQVADRTGWCPADPVTFESKLQKNIHVIGDAAIAGAMPRSASAAHSQAGICAAAIAALFAGKTPAAPTLTSSCYSLIAPDYAISQKGTYRPVDDQYTEAEGGPVISPQDARARARPKPSRPTPGTAPSPARCSDDRPPRPARSRRSRSAARRPCARGAAFTEIVGDAIPQSLTGKPGDPASGRAIVVKRENTCLLCHSGPFPEQRFQGDLSPSLKGTGARWSEGELRLRLVDATRLNPATIMPSYYRLDGLTRVAPNFRGKPALTAEQIEDVVAYLKTLKD